MKPLYFLSILLLAISTCISNSAFAQSVVNSTGNTIENSHITIEYAIGEIGITTIGDNPGYITQGLLQPVIKFKDCNLLNLVPNAFSPNNDNNNDCFGVKNWPGVSSFELTVYNRWGQLMFQTNNLIECWNGQVKGQPQPSGVYVYTLKVATETCGTIKSSGSLLLIR